MQGRCLQRHRGCRNSPKKQQTNLADRRRAAAKFVFLFLGTFWRCRRVCKHPATVQIFVRFKYLGINPKETRCQRDRTQVWVSRFRRHETYHLFQIIQISLMMGNILVSQACSFMSAVREKVLVVKREQQCWWLVVEVTDMAVLCLNRPRSRSSRPITRSCRPRRRTLLRQSRTLVWVL